MGATELLDELQAQGISVSLDGSELVLRPGSKLPPDLVREIRKLKAEIMLLLSRTACTCNPLPSQTEYGAIAQAGCGQDYKRCDACGYRWQCRLCGGCRRCRTPG